MGKGPLHPELVGPSWHLTSLGEAVCQGEGLSQPASQQGRGGGLGPRCPPPVPTEGEDLAAFPARPLPPGTAGFVRKLLGTARWVSTGDCSVGLQWDPGPNWALPSHRLLLRWAPGP